MQEEQIVNYVVKKILSMAPKKQRSTIKGNVLQAVQQVFTSPAGKKIMHRHYQIPSGYSNCLDFLSLLLLNLCLRDSERNATSAIASLFLKTWILEDHPIFLLDPLLFKALANTNLPLEVEVPPKVFEYALFIVPKNIAKDSQGKDVSFFLMTHSPSSSEVHKLLGSQFYSILCFTEANTYLELMPIVSNKIDFGQKPITEQKEIINNDSKELTETILKVSIQICMLLSSIPDAIEDEICYSINKPAKNGTNSQWEKRIVPRRIKIPDRIAKNIKYQKSEERDAGEAGRTVRTHWRRGHWHRVRHGKNWEQIRWQWFPPTIVNPQLRTI